MCVSLCVCVCVCVCGVTQSVLRFKVKVFFFFSSSQPSSLSVFLTICQFLCYMFLLLLISFPHLAFCSLSFLLLLSLCRLAHPSVSLSVTFPYASASQRRASSFSDAPFLYLCRTFFKKDFLSSLPPSPPFLPLLPLFFPSLSL